MMLLHARRFTLNRTRANAAYLRADDNFAPPVSKTVTPPARF
jgi:hypothetical protein